MTTLSARRLPNRPARVAKPSAGMPFLGGSLEMAGSREALYRRGSGRARAGREEQAKADFWAMLRASDFESKELGERQGKGEARRPPGHVGTLTALGRDSNLMSARLSMFCLHPRLRSVLVSSAGASLPVTIAPKEAMAQLLKLMSKEEFQRQWKKVKAAAEREKKVGTILTELDEDDRVAEQDPHEAARRQRALADAAHGASSVTVASVPRVCFPWSSTSRAEGRVCEELSQAFRFLELFALFAWLPVYENMTLPHTPLSMCLFHHGHRWPCSKDERYQRYIYDCEQRKAARDYRERLVTHRCRPPDSGVPQNFSTWRARTAAIGMPLGSRLLECKR